MLDDADGSNVEGGSEGIIPGGAGIGIGFMISSMLNLGITLRSWLCPWWPKPPPWCCCCWCIGCCLPAAWGKDFGSWDFDGSAFRAFHLSFNAFRAIALLRSLSCWSDGEIDIVRERRSLELEWFKGMIGWCLTRPMLKLNLYIGLTIKLMTGWIAVGKKLKIKVIDKKVCRSLKCWKLTSQMWSFQNLCL